MKVRSAVVDEKLDVESGADNSRSDERVKAKSELFARDSRFVR